MLVGSRGKKSGSTEESFPVETPYSKGVILWKRNLKKKKRTKGRGGERVKRVAETESLGNRNRENVHLEEG